MKSTTSISDKFSLLPKNNRKSIIGFLLIFDSKPKQINKKRKAHNAH